MSTNSYHPFDSSPSPKDVVRRKAQDPPGERCFVNTAPTTTTTTSAAVTVPKHRDEQPQRHDDNETVVDRNGSGGDFRDNNHGRQTNVQQQESRSLSVNIKNGTDTMMMMTTMTEIQSETNHPTSESINSSLDHHYSHISDNNNDPTASPLPATTTDSVQKTVPDTPDPVQPPTLSTLPPSSSSATSVPTTITTISTTKPTKPGAYRVMKTRPPGTTTYKVIVPQNVQPGTEFTVEIPEVIESTTTNATSDNRNEASATPNNRQNRRVQVLCPIEDTIPGETEIEILVPRAASYQYRSLKAAQLTLSPTTSSIVAGKAVYPMMKNIQQINQQAVQLGGTIRTRVITIPSTAIPGQTFTYYMNDPNIHNTNGNDQPKKKGGKLKVECPNHCRPGVDRIRIILPPELPEPEPLYQTFQVVVPDGATGGGHFAIEIGGPSTANQQQVLVECPVSSKPGDTLTIQLPTRTVVDQFQALTYPSTGTGWKRTVRVSDLHFQWVRLEESIVRSAPCTAAAAIMSGMKNGDLDWMTFHEKAYVRKLVPLEGNDPRLRTASVTLVSAETASVPSKLKTPDGDAILFSYADIAHQQGLPLQAKHEWFLEVCQMLSKYASRNTTDTTQTVSDIPPDSTMSQSVRILVRREHLINDSLRAILSLSNDDMRRDWELEFINESGIDQGGLTKEWIHCVTEQIFHPNTGLFLPSLNNQAAVDINPASAVACPNFHLLYYRFVGRVLGRALFTGHLVKGHFVRLLYKHLLGWPLTIEDIRDQDDGYYAALHEVMKMDDESLASICLDFTVSEEYGDVRIVHELIENGSSVALCHDNLPSYIEANIRYRLFDRIVPQLTEVLLGFYDVVPEQALAVFDANELELVLCGLPRINVDDWQSNIVYDGLFTTGMELVVQWFWEIVRDVYDLEMKARLLQFVTGTSGVPPGGFAYLKGSDDTPRQFTIQGIQVTSQCIYPKAHTCFNVLDLPIYHTKEELQQRLTFSITTSFVGFEAE